MPTHRGALYGSGVSPLQAPPHSTMLEAFAASVRSSPELAAIRHFDEVLSSGWLNDAADGLACALSDLGFGAGDRLALFTQNDPWPDLPGRHFPPAKASRRSRSARSIPRLVVTTRDKR